MQICGTQAGLATLYVGDAVEATFSLPEQVDVTITSPPYNLGMDYGDGGKDDKLPYADYLAWSRTYLQRLRWSTSPSGRLLLNLPTDINDRGHRGQAIVRPLSCDVLAEAIAVGWRYQGTIDWLEGNVGRRTAWGSYSRPSAPFVLNPNERVFVLHRDDFWKREPGGKTWDIEPEQFKAWTLGAWEIPGESARRIGHPAPFPQELVRRLLLLFSFCEDVVYDPFMGSGTTNLVANRLGRRSIGVDRNPDYVALAARRIADDGVVTDRSGNRFVASPLPLPVYAGSDHSEDASGSAA